MISKKPKTNITTAVLLSLWTLSTQETFREISDRFGIAISTTYNLFFEVCRRLYSIKHKFIIWPENDSAEQVVKKFNSLRTNCFPNVIGCVDGSHIQITGCENDSSFYNRKGYNSIILQCVCDSSLCFIDVYAGWPGSVHDAKVWTSSPLYSKLKTNPTFINKNYHLLGDSAYPLDSFLMKPYKDNGHLSRKQVHFNRTLSATRICIEQAFGRLKGLFRRLKYIQCYKHANVKFIIIAACVIHNIIIKRKDLIDINVEEILQNDDERIEHRNENDQDENEFNENIHEAQMKRDHICETIFVNT